MQGLVPQALEPGFQIHSTSEPMEEDVELEGMMPQASQHGSSTFDSILHNQQIQMQALVNILKRYLGFTVESESTDKSMRIILDGDQFESIVELYLMNQILSAVLKM
jgi:hypothetical protein